jgi:uncharacterized membrane protein
MSLTLLAQTVSRLRSGYLFLPLAMSLAGALVALGMGWLDRLAGKPDAGDWADFFLTDAAGARTILSGIAASAITVAGVIFSITMVVLASVSSQFGPRLLPNFVKQESTKFVMGGFIGTFIYCMVALAAISTREGHRHVPQFSTLGGLILGIFSFLLLIFFIHRVALFIQAPRVIDDVACRLLDSMTHLFPEDAGKPQKCVISAHGSWQPSDPSLQPHEISVAKDGYLQAMDTTTLLAIAVKNDLIIRIHRRPGHFIIARDPIIKVWSKGPLPKKISAQIRRQLFLGPERTDTQDAEFAVEQLVEVAVRALSPGINDPFTAINCIDRLGGALAFLSTREMPSALRYDDEGHLRLVGEPHTYRGIIDAAFNQLRQHARHEEAVAIRLMDLMAQLAQRPLPREFRQALEKHMRLLDEGLHNGKNIQKHDRRDFDRRYQSAVEAVTRDPDAAEDDATHPA